MLCSRAKDVTLPNDVWYKILSYTDVMTISRCRLVNLQVHQVSYEILREYDKVSVFKLFSDLRRTPTKNEIITTLNALPRLTELTIRVPDALFRFKVGDTFCATHISSTLKKVVFHACDLTSNHFIRFVTACETVATISLYNHDSINDGFIDEVMKYCHDFVVMKSDAKGQRRRSRGKRRRFDVFELGNTKCVSKDMITTLLDSFVAKSICLIGMGQLDHVKLGIHQDTAETTSIVNEINESPPSSSSWADAMECCVVLKKNPHLRRMTIGNGGGTSRMTGLEITRCQLYSLKIDDDNVVLNVKELKLTYGRWLSTIQCKMGNAFERLETLDLTSSDALHACTFDRLFGLGKNNEESSCDDELPKMRNLTTLILCETLIERLWLVGYSRLEYVHIGGCVMLQSVVVKQCSQLKVLQMDRGGAALMHLDVTVDDACEVKGMPVWITSTSRQRPSSHTNNFYFSVNLS